MLTISHEGSADRLYAAADLLTCLSDLISARSRDGEIALSDDGACGLNHILMCVARYANAGADELTTTNTEAERRSRQLAVAEYERGFQNGIAAGREQVNVTVTPQPQRKKSKDQLVEDMAAILRSAADIADEKDKGAPVPELTEQSTEQIGVQGAAKSA